MTPLVWANFPLVALVVLAWVGIPLWLTVKRPDTTPDYSQTHPYLAYLAARQPRSAPHRADQGEDLAEQPEPQLVG